MIPQKVIKFLEKAGAKYEPIKHRTVYTAYDKAATLRVSPKFIGKTLMVKFNKEAGLVLIPANRNLDKGKFKKIVNNLRKKKGEKAVKTINFATEALMKKNLKGVKVGAIPPFGNLWSLARRGQRPGGKLITFVDRSLLKAPKIFVNAGDYNWSLKISPASLKKLLPDLIVGNFGKAK